MISLPSPSHWEERVSSHTNSPLPLLMKYDIYVACVHRVRAKQSISCVVFSQLAHRHIERLFPALIILMVIWTKMDGFQIKILGLLVCSPNLLFFQKWANSTVNASQPQIKIADFLNFSSAQSNKIGFPFGVALPQRTQAMRSCQHESAWPSSAQGGVPAACLCRD